MTAYDALFAGVLSRMDPERAHHVGFRAIRMGRGLSRAVVRVPDGARVEAMGLSFPNPLGLAAGFDKNAVGIDALAALGFGFVEVGTVTALAQPGNPRPRLFRLTDDRAIVNRMGFNNDGAEAVAGRLASRSARLDRRDRRARVNLSSGSARPVVGINIGKSKVVPDDDQQAVLTDYATSARLLAPHADYLVVNVSSPNTPGLRSLQAVERLAPLIDEVRRVADEAARRPVPLCVKIAPDLADEDVVAVGELARDRELEGLIATNTTIARDGLRTPSRQIEAVGAGGLSGPVLRRRSVEVLRILRAHAPRTALISVGGISSAADVRERQQAGATLVQAYTGFVYGGPLWPREVVKGLAG